MAKKRALVVGINDYPPPNRLPSCVNDMNAFKNILASVYGFTEIQTLCDSGATKAKFTATITDMVSGATADDRFVIYYSGHGYSNAPDGVIKQFIVLIDGFFAGSDLAALTTALPPGVLTVVLDSCFSGGMEKPYFVTSESKEGVERALSKLWTPITDDQIDKSFEKPITAYEPFGCAPIDMTTFPGTRDTQIFMIQNMLDQPGSNKQFDFLAKGQVPPTLFHTPSPAEAFERASNGGAAGALLLNGLLVAACQDNETAAASNSLTNGLSAFTFCLQQEISSKGGNGSAAEVVTGAQSRLKSLGFRQTPVVKTPPKPVGMEDFSFVNLSPFGKVQTGVAPAGARSLSDLIAELLDRLNGTSPQGGKSAHATSSDQSVTKGFQPLGEMGKALDPSALVSIILEVVRALRSLQTSPVAVAEKGFDPATLVPLVVQIFQAMTKGHSAAPQEKVFGIDDALAAALVSVAATAINVATKKSGQFAPPVSEMGSDIGSLGPVIVPIVQALSQGR